MCIGWEADPGMPIRGPATLMRSQARTEGGSRLSLHRDRQQRITQRDGRISKHLVRRRSL